MTFDAASFVAGAVIGMIAIAIPLGRRLIDAAFDIAVLTIARDNLATDFITERSARLRAESAIIRAKLDLPIVETIR